MANQKEGEELKRKGLATTKSLFTLHGQQLMKVQLHCNGAASLDKGNSGQIQIQWKEESGDSKQRLKSQVTFFTEKSVMVGLFVVQNINAEDF